MKLILPSIADHVGLKGLINDGNIHIIHAILVFAGMFIFGIYYRRSMRDIDKKLIPSSKPSLTGIFEAISEALLRLMESAIGEDARHYFPLIATLFFFILTCNVMGSIPGLLPPTNNINTNMACALTVFVYYNIIAVRRHGFIGYLKELSGPVIWLAPLILSIEVISHMVRPISLSIRLFGNVTGDYMVIEIFSDLMPWIIPIPFMFLELLVDFIQAFVFTLLSIIYISLATGGHSKKEEA